MQNLEPVNVAVAILSLMLGPALASVVGPYAVIMLASTVGAAWSLGRRNTGTKLSAASYFLLINGTAILVTVSAATQLAQWIGAKDAGWLLAPVALIIGGVGQDWPSIIKWAAARAMRLIERRAGVEGEK